MTSARAESAGSDIAALGRLCDIAIDVPIVSADDPAGIADRLFADDPTLTALVVATADGPRALPRAHVAWVLSGRFGYGRPLHARSTIGALLPVGIEAPLSGEMPLAAAAAVLGARTIQRRYDDLLVLTDHGPRVASVAALLEQVSRMFQHIALHDALTGLPNRLGLEQHGHRLQPTRPVDLAVCYVDLDGFKAVNDTFGHAAGDEVLATFADRLQQGMRPGDLVARLGGDEFAVVIMNVDRTTASGIAERIVRLASTPFMIDGAVLHLSASVGIAMLSNTARERGLSRLDVLLRDSDAAMLVAKRSGKNQLCHLTTVADPVTTSPLARAAQVRRRLQHALAVGALTLHYQAKFDVSDGRLESVEALVRWTDEELGAISPAEFIPIAEESGQIVRLGGWVLRQACHQSREWAQQGDPRVIAINVSPTQLRSPNYVDDLLTVVAELGVAPTDLRIEVTETAAITDLPATIAQLRRIRDAGFAVDLDDFGTGYSSLAMLRDLPLSSVKIDKHFVDRIETSQADEYLVRGVIQTAHALGLAVTAEGVERVGQLRRLRQLGCDTVQGFLTGRPVPAAAISDQWDAPRALGRDLAEHVHATTSLSVVVAG